MSGLKKYNIQKDFKEELKVFLFVVRPSNCVVNPEKLVGVLGYRSEDVIKTAGQQFCPPGSGLVAFSHGDYIPVSKILEAVKGKTSFEKINIKPVVQPIISPPKYSKEQFISGLLLVCDDFVKNKNDKKEIKRIISGIK
jgi:hypothetical protein